VTYIFVTRSCSVPIQSNILPLHCYTRNFSKPFPRTSTSPECRTVRGILHMYTASTSIVVVIFVFFGTRTVRNFDFRYSDNTEYCGGEVFVRTFSNKCRIGCCWMTVERIVRVLVHICLLNACTRLPECRTRTSRHDIGSPPKQSKNHPLLIFSIVVRRRSVFIRHFRLVNAMGPNYFEMGEIWRISFPHPRVVFRRSCRRLSHARRSDNSVPFFHRACLTNAPKTVSIKETTTTNIIYIYIYLRPTRTVV